MHQQPLYRGSPITGGHAANTHFDHGLCLPSGSALTEREQTRVVEAFTRALGVQPTIELTALDLRVRATSATSGQSGTHELIGNTPSGPIKSSNRLSGIRSTASSDEEKPFRSRKLAYNRRGSLVPVA